ncbi:electron transfer flavoprotein subunit alpha/FixB family protein [bacterium]|nr:MAG: electron transfer flavoprotein subunit alpha/FixB family protein [bacterium]
MNKDIFVVIEHRQERIADVSYELLTKGYQIAEKLGGEVIAVLLADDGDQMAQSLKSYADKVLYIRNEIFKNLHSEYYCDALSSIIGERKPALILFGHTVDSFEVAPALAEQLEIPIISNCVDFDIDGDFVRATVPLYGGKINGEYSFNAENGGIISVIPGAVKVENPQKSGEIEKIEFTFEKEYDDKEFIEFIEAAAGEIDITQAEKIVAIGRGVKDEENIDMIKDFADSIGAVLACSRPIVDAGWLPKERQVGSSGKTVKPKLYIALGISGAFQHISGIKSDTIIAVNKDPNAPIFKVAHYGIVDDVFKIIPALKAKIEEMK